MRQKCDFTIAQPQPQAEINKSNPFTRKMTTSLHNFWLCNWAESGLAGAA